MTIPEVSQSLKHLIAPKTHRSVWLGPFEQLSGAAYSLMRAEQDAYKAGAYLKTYHPAVQAKLSDRLTKLNETGEIGDESVFQAWRGRLHFNSAIQRIVFGSERLLSTMAFIQCTCGRGSELPKTKRWPKWGERRKGAQSRVDHIKDSHQPTIVTNIKLVLDQVQADYQPDQTFDPNRGIAMLRWAVNSRKHAVYLRSQFLDSQIDSTLPKTWRCAGPEKQWRTALDCLMLVCAAYSEAVAWSPDATD